MKNQHLHCLCSRPLFNLPWHRKLVSIASSSDFRKKKTGTLTIAHGARLPSLFSIFLNSLFSIIDKNVISNGDVFSLSR